MRSESQEDIVVEGGARTGFISRVSFFILLQVKKSTWGTDLVFSIGQRVHHGVPSHCISRLNELGPNIYFQDVRDG